MMTVPSPANPSGAPAASQALWAVLAAACLLTLLNAFKPVHMDDVIWWYFADHITRDPLHPFSFTITWAQVCQPAMNVMSPPMLPYGWAGAMAVFGDNPALWKLGFFPLICLLAWAVLDLARRFVPHLIWPVFWAVLLAPTVIPAQNLMQDIPAVSFLLGALAILLRACDRASLRGALLAGVFLGFACLTKWSTLHGFAILGLASLLFSPAPWRFVLACCGTAFAMFLGWELYLIAQEGQSHFLVHLGLQSGEKIERMGILSYSLMLSAGGLAPFAAVAGLAALTRSTWAAWAAAGLFIAGYGLLGLLQETYQHSALFLGFSLLLGLGLLPTVNPILNTLAALRLRTLPRLGLTPAQRGVLFLLGWLVIELAGYFVFSPFPAARRLISLLIALTLFVAAVLPHTVPRRAVWLACATQIGLGLFYTAVDIADATRLKGAVSWAQEQLDASALDPQTTWFSGEFGVDFYGIQAGFRHTCDNTLNPGDAFVEFDLYDRGRNSYALSQLLLNGDIQQQSARLITPTLPWSTSSPTGYYLGTRPMDARSGPLGRVTIYEIRAPIRFAE